MRTEKTVWVTGASSGLGLHTAMALRDAGWRVIAGARSFPAAGRAARGFPGTESGSRGSTRAESGLRPGPEDGARNPLRPGTESPGFAGLHGAHLLRLDVTDGDSVRTFRDAALAISPRVDAVVHCAGMLVLGSCEETAPEEFLRVMNTNFLGMVRVNREVLPPMRARGGGRIVMFSSINGLMGIPFQDAYTASKHAVEGYAEGLQMEVRPFGIRVTLVEPGDHRSGSDQYRLRAAGMRPDSPYAAAYEKTVRRIHRDETHGSDPDRLGRRVAALLERKHPPFRRRIASPEQHLAVWLHGALPPGWNERILRSYYIRGRD